MWAITTTAVSHPLGMVGHIPARALAEGTWTNPSWLVPPALDTCQHHAGYCSMQQRRHTVFLLPGAAHYHYPHHGYAFLSIKFLLRIAFPLD